MTREKAQAELREYSFTSNTYGNKKERFVDIRLGNAKIIMDDVYDDIESATCKNCKHWNQENGAQIISKRGMCDLHTCGDKYYAIGITGEDFGCIRYERRTDDA